MVTIGERRAEVIKAQQVKVVARRMMPSGTHGGETSSTERRTKLSEDVLHVNMILNGGLMVARLKKDGGQEGLNKLPTQTFRF